MWQGLKDLFARFGRVQRSDVSSCVCVLYGPSRAPSTPRLGFRV
jgi:hypothetical protein